MGTGGKRMPLGEENIYTGAKSKEWDVECLGMKVESVKMSQEQEFYTYKERKMPEWLKCTVRKGQELYS